MADAGAPVVEHKPYVPDEARVPEFTPKAIAVGALPRQGQTLQFQR